MSMSSLEWIVNGYTLSFAMLILTGGKLADFFGRRLFYLVGLVIFSLASLACGLASGGGVLIAARVVQGAGAALLMPATLSIITATFPHEERGTAIGIWARVVQRARSRSARSRRAPDRASPLELDLLPQRADRRARRARHARLRRRVEGHRGGAAPRSRRTRAGGHRRVRADLRADRLQPVRLGLDPHRRPVRAERGLPRWLRCARGTERLPMLKLSLFRSRVFSGANTVALLVALALFGIISTSPSTCRTSSATRR